MARWRYLLVINPGQGRQLETRDGVVMNGAAAEHVREAIPVLASYADAVGIRSFAGGKELAADLEERDFRRMAALSPVPVINLESAANHPCQALGDWKTLDDLFVPRRGGRFVLSWANHPKPLPLRCRRRRRRSRCAAWRWWLRPDAYALPEEVAGPASRGDGGSRRTADRRRARGRRRSHKSLRRPTATRRSRRRCGESRRQVRRNRGSRTPGGPFMHCLPALQRGGARRGARRPRSIVIRRRATGCSLRWRFASAARRRTLR
jgi:N-acetylornithine carbamoyltransferase